MDNLLPGVGLLDGVEIVVAFGCGSLLVELVDLGVVLLEQLDDTLHPDDGIVAHHVQNLAVFRGQMAEERATSYM